MLAIVLNIVVSLGVSAQFFLDHVIKKKDRKKSVALSIVICTLAGLWGNYAIQSGESDALAQGIETLRSLNSDMKADLHARDSSLIRIRSQNEFLIEQMIEIRDAQKSFNILARNLQEASRVREVREATGPSVPARKVTLDLAARMKAILARHRSAKVTLTCIMGDQEGFQFATQLKEILNSAGWEVNGVNQAIYTNPLVGVFLKVQSRQYPSRVNALVEAFQVLNIKVEGFLESTFAPDDVELIVGGKP